jgi:predicted HTH domain antitoxin
MRTLVLNIPDTIDLDDKEALMAIASRLYEKGKLTIGQSAELAGLSKGAFMEILGNYGVSVFNFPPSDLDRDVENAKGHNL